MKPDLLLVALRCQERHFSSSVSGSGNGFSVSLVGRRHSPEVAHPLEHLRGAPRNHPLLGYPSGIGIGIAFRHRPLAGVTEVSLCHPLPHLILHRRGLVLLGPCPCPLSLVPLPHIYKCLPAPLPIRRAFDEGSSAFVVNAMSKDLVAL